MSPDNQNSAGREGIAPEEVAHLAGLARLGLTDHELETMGRELNAIIGAVNKLLEADISQVDPTTQVGGLRNIAREDRVVPGLSSEEALQNAASQEAGLLRVPAIQ